MRSFSTASSSATIPRFTQFFFSHNCLFLAPLLILSFSLKDRYISSEIQFSGSMYFVLAFPCGKSEKSGIKNYVVISVDTIDGLAK